MAINEVMLQTMGLTRGAESTQDVVENWHREEHAGRFEHCTEQPCHAINRRSTEDGR